MKYPMLANWTSIETESRLYKICDLFNQETYWTDNRDFISLAEKLDGKTDPFSISSNFSIGEINAALAEMRRCHLIRYNRIAFKWFGSIGLTLFIPHNSPKCTVISKVINMILLCSFLPVLLLGLWMFYSYVPFDGDDHFVSGCVIGLFTGVVFHELGHAVAQWAAGGRVLEFGISINNFLPGAYAMIPDDNGKMIKWQTIQVDAAGMEMNCFLSGIYFVLSVLVPGSSALFFYSATINLAFFFINISFAAGHDGIRIIEKLLDIP